MEQTNCEANWKALLWKIGGGILSFREKLLDFKRRLSDRKMYSIVVVIIAAVAIWGVVQYRHAAQLRQQLDNQYNRAFYDMTGYVNNVEVLLVKSLIASTPIKAASTLQEAWRQANLAQTNLGQLPVDQHVLANTSKYLTQVGDLAYSLNNQNMSGKQLNDDLNLNSFRSILRASENEAKRQIREIEDGGRIIQETRRWDDNKGYSYAMRSKEEANDYRYFPEPDLVPVVIDDEWLNRIKSSLPELPAARMQRYVQTYSLPEYDAGILTSSKHLADFFEEAVTGSSNAKAISNWIMGDMMRILKERELEVEAVPFPGKYLAQLVALIDKGTISGTIARKVFEKMFETGKEPSVIVKEEGLEVVSDEGALAATVRKILEANPQSVADFKSGKEKAMGFLVGQCMREMKGKADPQTINKLLKEELAK
jgi:Asp-tRNA(Asn)/Glu-tRNA(Gln) amidotransferase B subunit